MPTLTAFVPKIAGVEGDAHWVEVRRPPYVVSYGADDFIELPAGLGLRAYVNGYKVLGRLQVLGRGDFVRVIGRDKQQIVCFRFAGRGLSNVEAGHGRRCAFTRTVIKDKAVLCSTCGQVVSEEAAKQIGSCVCGSKFNLGDSNRPELPPEELI